ERAAADEEDVRRVDRDVLLLRVLPAALRGNVADRPLEHLQERLLDSLAGDVAGDRDVVPGLADLVDLVDEDDPLLALLDVPVGVLQQSEDEVLDVLPDVAGLGQRRRVADRERYVEDARERPREQGLPAARGADQEDVALLDFDVVERDL